MWPALHTYITSMDPKKEKAPCVYESIFKFMFMEVGMWVNNDALSGETLHLGKSDTYYKVTATKTTPIIPDPDTFLPLVPLLGTIPKRYYTTI